MHYATLLLTHRIVVSLFLIQYVIKLLLLLTGKNEQLAKYSKVTKVPEMIVSFLFLVTGVWMLVDGAIINKIFIVKLICVFAAIPVAVIGFKKANKGLALLAVVLVVLAYGFAEMSRAVNAGGKMDTATTSSPLEAGKMIYSQTCVTCHGVDGKLGRAGAKDLSVSSLSTDEQKMIIRHGKNSMPPYKKLTDEQVDDVVQYIATLKK